MTGESDSAIGPEFLQVARNIQAVRVARGQTMDELSALSGLSKAYLSRIESGERTPSLAALFALARAWDVDVAAFFRSSGPRTVTRVRRTATVDWHGGPNGEGMIAVGSGLVSGVYSQQQRIDGTGVNPEELIGAAHAGCFAMHLATLLSGDGHEPERLVTTAEVHGEFTPNGFRIARIELSTVADVHGLSRARFQEYVQRAHRMCPVSLALAGVEIVVRAERRTS
jgi:lipoyl-dependent peroxiredoxin